MKVCIYFYNKHNTGNHVRSNGFELQQSDIIDKKIMEILLTSILAFFSTNIDDIFILILFFGDKRYTSSDIYIGQYSGIIVLIGVSIVGAIIGNFVDIKFIGLLGLFPMYLGLRNLIDLFKGENDNGESKKEEKKGVKTGILNIAAVTFANGGDNIGTYVPLFTTLTTSDKIMMISIFLIMVFVWLTMAKYLTKHPMLAKVISKYGHIVTPVVLILLGLFIIKKCGSIELISHTVLSGKTFT